MESFSSQQDRRKGLKKSTVLLLGVGLGVAGWHWRHYANAPLWVYRAYYADHNDLYLGKTNGIPNRTLVQTARRYLAEFTQIEVSGQTMSSSEFQNLGIVLDPAWFNHHAPASVDYNPFAPESQGNFIITWLYQPGCEHVVRKIPSTPGPEWFDVTGHPCYGGFLVTVLMAPNMKLTNLRLTKITGPTE